MKKLVFLFAMVFAVSMVMGQTPDNKSVVNQQSIDDGNWYSVIQKPDGGNLVLINQIAKLDNWASVNQNGSGNKLVNAAGDAWATRAASVDPDNPAMQVSDNSYNWMNVSQRGSNNEIGLHQEATGLNHAEIVQRQGSNVLAVYQGGKAEGEKASQNYLYADQIGGTGNYASLSQGRSDNYADIFQNGSGNILGGYNCNGVVVTGTSYQYASQNGSDLLLTQVGDDNKVGIYQRTDGGPAFAEISQSGDRNELAVRQNTDIIAEGTILSDQRGDDNLVLLNQNPRSGKSAYAEIKQFGGTNKLVGADVSGNILTSCAQQIAGNVTTADVTLFLNQRGGGNTAGLYQQGTDSSLANISQTGGLNMAVAYQLTTGGANELQVIQSGGDVDVSTGIQIGAGNNYAFISQ